MPRAFALVEMLLVIMLIGLISLPLAMLSRTTLWDIPQAYRMIGGNSSLQNLVKQIGEDVSKAEALPQSAAACTANDQTLLIRLSDCTIVYQKKDGHFIRKSLSEAADSSGGKSVKNWAIPHGRVFWRIRRGQDGDVVEVESYLEQKTGQCVVKKMAISHLFFVGVYQEPVSKK